MKRPFVFIAFVAIILLTITLRSVRGDSPKRGDIGRTIYTGPTNQISIAPARKQYPDYGYPRRRGSYGESLMHVGIGRTIDTGPANQISTTPAHKRYTKRGSCRRRGSYGESPKQVVSFSIPVILVRQCSKINDLVYDCIAQVCSSLMNRYLCLPECCSRFFIMIYPFFLYRRSCARVANH